MSTWREERRADRAAEAAERRNDIKFQTEMDRDERRRERDDKRADDARRRRERGQRRQARAARREKALTPGNIYRKGTLALVAASAAASLPAQIMHFAAISLMLLPIPFALEGAAWVMAAGVAYADERKLPVWVRWLLRGFSLSAAGFAAHINFAYGMSLTADGLTAAQAAAVGWGLAAVTLGGPLFFEVRQWVTTLDAKAGDPKRRSEEKARAKHEKKRRSMFPAVAKRQKQILLSAPFGTVRTEDAWKAAWLDVEGAPVGVTADVVADRLTAEDVVAEVLREAERTPERVAVELLLADLFPASPGDGGLSGGASAATPTGGPRGGGSQGRAALGGKGKRPVRSTSGTGPVKPLKKSDIEAVKKLAEALGGVDRLSARNVREAVGCRSEYAVRLRDAVRDEKQGENQ